MDKTIVGLLIAGAVLAVLHIPATVIHLGIITVLLLVSVKWLWWMLQRFSSSDNRSNNLI